MKTQVGVETGRLPPASGGGDARPPSTPGDVVGPVGPGTLAGRHYHVERCRETYPELPELVAEYHGEHDELDQARKQHSAAVAEKTAAEGHLAAVRAAAPKRQDRSVVWTGLGLGVAGVLDFLPIFLGLQPLGLSQSQTLLAAGAVTVLLMGGSFAMARVANPTHRALIGTLLVGAVATLTLMRYIFVVALGEDYPLLKVLFLAIWTGLLMFACHYLGARCESLKLARARWRHSRARKREAAFRAEVSTRTERVAAARAAVEQLIDRYIRKVGAEVSSQPNADEIADQIRQQLRQELLDTRADDQLAVQSS